MGAKAAAFCKAHPDSNPGTAQVAARLIELSARADKLLEQNRAGIVAATTAVADKATLRAAVAADLQALMKISRQAAHRHPEISVHRRIPLARSSETEFYTSARVAVANATALMEVMAPFGLSTELLSSLTQGLDAFKAALDRKRDGLGTQIGAGADLDAVSHEIMGVVASLDAVHAIRFKTSPDQQAAWKSARNVAWPSSTAIDSTAPAPAPAVPTTPVAPVTLVENSKAA